MIFYDILSDCHYSDVINSLLNAFRLKKVCNRYFLDISEIAMYIMLIRIGWPEKIILRLLAKKAQEVRLLN